MLNLTTNPWSDVDVPPSNTSASSWRALVALVASFALLAVVIVQLGHDGAVSTVAGTEQPAEQSIETVAELPDIGPAVQPAPTTEVITPAPVASATESFAWRPARASQDIFLDPRAVTRRFASDVLGMTAPTLGGYRPTDEASGLVDVRAHAGGPATSILLHRDPTSGWWSVVGASSDHIVVEQPVVNGTIDDPLRVSGAAIAVGGRVELGLWADGNREPLLVREFVIRAGEDPDWFEGVFGWTPSGADGAGAVVLRTFDPDTGSVLEAAVVPVRFAPAGQ